MGKTSGQCFGWGGWIPGSEAGNFLMGAGSFLHHVEDAALRAAVEMVVAGIRSFQDPSTGWVWAFNESSLNEDNLPDYCAGWVTRGLLDAAGAGVPDALALARESISLFNNHTSLVRACHHYRERANGAAVSHFYPPTVLPRRQRFSLPTVGPILHPSAPRDGTMSHRVAMAKLKAI